MKALIEECKLILNGKFIWLMLLVPLIIAVAFGYVFQNGQLNEASIAVVDLDQSTYSQQLITKLDADQYIHVKYVTYNYSKPDMFLYNEDYLGVIYLPTGLEKANAQGKQMNIGFYVDNTMTAATGSLRSGVTEVFAAENATAASTKLISMGINSSQASTFSTGLSLQTRILYNPTNNTLMSSVVSFINTVFLSLLGSATVGIVARLRHQGQLADALRHPLSIIVRIVPYCIIASISMYLVLGCLKQIGGMRFEANVYELWIPLIVYAIATALLCMIVGWSSSNPSKATGKIIFIILPSFLLSGAQLPVALLPTVLQYVSYALPLTWFFEFLRGMGFRGGELQYFSQEMGSLLILITCFLALIFLLMLNEMNKIRKVNKEGIKHPDEVDSANTGIISNHIGEPTFSK